MSVRLYDFYLSYHWKNLTNVIKLHKLLVSNGYKVYLDLVEMKFGDNIDERVETAIQNSNIFLCFITQEYLQTGNCNRELKYAYKQFKSIYSILIEKFTHEMLPNEIHLENVYEMSDNVDNIHNGQILEFIRKNYASKAIKKLKHRKLYNFLPTVQAYRA